MAWPVIASTATTLSVFFPLLFWTGMVGEFMKFLPITVILTLFASLFMALIFIPVMGGIIGKRQPQTAASKAALAAADSGDPRRIGGVTGAYVRVLNWAILRPAATVLLTVAMLLGSFDLPGLWSAAGLGALIGLGHGAFLIAVFLPLLPVVHPRLASGYDGPSALTQIEPPGAFGLNYGGATPATTVAAQCLYGLILGLGYGAAITG